MKLTLYRQDTKGNWLPVSNFNVQRHERLKIQVQSGVDWLSSVRYTLQGIDLNPIQRNLGTDRIIAPGYNRKSDKQFIAPSTAGSYMVSANWNVLRGWPIQRIQQMTESITINVTDNAQNVQSIEKPGTGDQILSGLKNSAFLVWGLVAFVVLKEVKKLK